ncbi:hypothetical protein HK104_005874, partial [Borealophlyctis nickersoniae]
NAGLSTNPVLEELKNLRMIEHKVAMECFRMSNNLAGRLENVEFRLRNKTALDETILKEFVQNADTFEWFKGRFPKIAESMQRGLDERTRPHLDEKSRKIQELEEQLRRAQAVLGGGTKLLMDKDTDSNSPTHFTDESESESEAELLNLDWVLDEDGEIIGGTFVNPFEPGRLHRVAPSDHTVTAPRDKGNQREETNGTGSSSTGTAAQRLDRTVANTGSSTIRGPSDCTVTAPRDKGDQREETKRKLSNTVTNEKAQKKPKT